MTATTDAPQDHPQTGLRRVTPGRVAAAIVCIAVGVLWVYIFTIGGDRRPEGWLTDRTFPTQAERICRRMVADLAQLTPAREEKTPESRARTVLAATDRLERMLGELRAVVPATGDARWINRWIADWEPYLEDRRSYARRLPGNPRAEFFVTRRYGSQVTRAIDRYAETNQMPSCITPDDV